MSFVFEELRIDWTMCLWEIKPSVEIKAQFQTNYLSTQDSEGLPVSPPLSLRTLHLTPFLSFFLSFFLSPSPPPPGLPHHSLARFLHPAVAVPGRSGLRRLQPAARRRCARLPAGLLPQVQGHLLHGGARLAGLQVGPTAACR